MVTKSPSNPALSSLGRSADFSPQPCRREREMEDFLNAAGFESCCRLKSMLRWKIGRLFRLSCAAWARILALFFTLALIKTALLVQLGKHVFETHWRVGSIETNWWD